MVEAGSPILTLGAALRVARQRLREAGLPTPDLDARILVAEALQLEPSGLISGSNEPLAKGAAAFIDALLLRRLAGESVHRILGRRAFYEHEFVLSAQTLEPRPDTEILVDLASEALAISLREREECVFADVGTGSGAIAVSLLAKFALAIAIAIDVSFEAVQTALVNARRAGVAQRCHGLAGDYLSGCAAPLDVIVSNPPYIPSGVIETLAPEVRLHDPRRALDGGADGLQAYRTIAAEAPRVLRRGGSVVVEIGQGQGEDVAAIFGGSGFFEVGSAQILSGTLRAMWFQADT